MHVYEDSSFQEIDKTCYVFLFSRDQNFKVRAGEARYKGRLFMSKSFNPVKKYVLNNSK